MSHTFFDEAGEPLHPLCHMVPIPMQHVHSILLLFRLLIEVFAFLKLFHHFVRNDRQLILSTHFMILATKEIYLKNSSHQKPSALADLSG